MGRLSYKQGQEASALVSPCTGRIPEPYTPCARGETSRLSGHAKARQAVRMRSSFTLCKRNLRFVTPCSVLLAALLAACDDDLSERADASLAPDSGSVLDAATYEEPRDCIELPSNTATVALDVFRDDWGGSCRPEGARDAAFLWTAPAAGRYLFHTRAAASEGETAALTFDDAAGGEVERSPILSVLDGACEGDELVCTETNVSLEEGWLTRTVARLEADQTVTIVLDLPGSVDDPSAEAAELHYLALLEIEPVACAEIDLGDEAEAHWDGQIFGTHPPIGPVSCSPDTRGAPTEKSWLYRAPVAGRYIVSLEADYTPVALAAFTEGCLEELECVAAGENEVASLEVELEADQVLTLVGSARSTGDSDWRFTLDIALQTEP